MRAFQRAVQRTISLQPIRATQAPRQRVPFLAQSRLASPVSYRLLHQTARRWASDLEKEQANDAIAAESSESQDRNEGVPRMVAGRDSYEPLKNPSFGGLEPTPNRTLYVGNLLFSVESEELQEMFSQYGRITSTRIVTDQRGISRGFGYVEFENREDAENAIREHNQQEYKGRRMMIQFHVPRERNAGDNLRPRATMSSGEPTSTLFIGNMSYQMSDRDLNDLFRDIKNVLDIRVAMDRRTGTPRGFAHADFMDIASAEAAKQILDNKVVYGRSLRIDFSKPSSPRAGYSQNQQPGDQ